MAFLSAVDLFNVNGMVFVITGGGTGIGRMMADTLDQNGAAKVYILGRRLEKLQEVAKEAKNGSIVAVQADITSTKDLQEAAALVKSQAGFVNAVIANSGVPGPSNKDLPKDRTSTIAEIQDSILKVPQADFTNTFAVNNTAVLYTMAAFLDLLDAGNKSDKSVAKAQGIKSQFIVTSSIGGMHRLALGGFIYGGSKAGVNHMVKTMATYLVPHHIRCNVIAPGMYPSEMNYMVTSESLAEGAYPQSLIPLTRAGTSQDMAGAILSLCGRGGAYYNGFVLVTDGGRLSVVPGTY